MEVFLGLVTIVLICIIRCVRRLCVYSAGPLSARLIQFVHLERDIERATSTAPQEPDFSAPHTFSYEGIVIDDHVRGIYGRWASPSGHEGGKEHAGSKGRGHGDECR